MNRPPLSLLLTVNALVGGAFGLLLLILPGPLLQLFGFNIGVDSELVARLYGTELLGFNVATWLARPLGAGPALQRAVVAGHIVNETAGFAVVAGAIVAGRGNLMMWPFATLLLGFAVAFSLALTHLSDRHIKWSRIFSTS